MTTSAFLEIVWVAALAAVVVGAVGLGLAWLTRGWSLRWHVVLLVAVAGLGSYAGTLFTPDYSSAIKHRKHEAKVRKENGGSATAPVGSSTGSTGGSTGGTVTGGDGSSGGAAGGTTNDPVKAITDGVHQVASAIPSPLAPVVSQVADVLDSTAATLLCQAQLGNIPGLSSLLKPAVAGCATKVTGETKADALADIPNTLKGVLAWLHLA